MSRKHIATFALLAAAALPAPAFRVGVTADHLKAEINDRPVAVAIVHSCTGGEGYTGEAKLTCGGMKGRPVGFETEKDREAVFEDVARLFPLQPGTHAFEGEVVLTDTGGGETTEADSVTVDFRRWNSIGFEVP